MSDCSRGVFRSLAVSLLVLFACLTGFLLEPSHSQSESSEKFARWLETVRIRALEEGISSRVLDTHLSDLSLDTRVVENASNQAEFNTPYPEYRGYFVTAKMIEKGQLLKRKHHRVLRTLEERYGVPAEILLAVWGIESRYGEKKSKFRALPSLASMAFSNPSRRDYFRDELLTVLRMIDNNRVREKNLMSSWAGALGQPQFMPSSYRTYAVDYDEDDYPDIWDNPADVLASIANYLEENGWDSSATWGKKVSGESAVSDSSVFTPRGTNNRYRRSKNFSVLLSYNQSNFYALTVGLLSEKIGGLEELDG